MIDVDPREARLPQWAQATLANARRRVAHAEKRADDARLATGAAGSLVITDRFDDIPIGLGDRPVSFLPRLGAHPLDAIEVKPYEGGIQVYTPRGPMRVEPQVSNVVNIWAPTR